MCLTFLQYSQSSSLKPLSPVVIIKFVIYTQPGSSGSGCVGGGVFVPIENHLFTFMKQIVLSNKSIFDKISPGYCDLGK